MRLIMYKNRSKYALMLLGVIFSHTALQGVWWNASVQKKQQNNSGPSDYENTYGESLRKYSQIFPRVPARGPILWHQVLGVEENADKNEIKKAFRTLLLKTHPDKGVVTNIEPIKAVNAVKEELEARDFSAKVEYEMIWNGNFDSQFGNFDMSGPGTVPSVESLSELFARSGEEDKADLVDSSAFKEEFKNVTDEWKRFYIAKWVLLIGVAVGYNYLKKLSASEKDSWFKRNKTIQAISSRWSRFKKEHPRIVAIMRGSVRGGFIACAALYPLYRYRKPFSWASLNHHYKSEIVTDKLLSEDDLKLYYRMIKVGERQYKDQFGRVTRTEDIREPSYPLGYMTSEQERKEFMLIRKAYVMSALSAASSLATAWMGLII